jgi:hypothetical protein
MPTAREFGGRPPVESHPHEGPCIAEKCTPLWIHNIFLSVPAASIRADDPVGHRAGKGLNGLLPRQKAKAPECCSATGAKSCSRPDEARVAIMKKILLTLLLVTIPAVSLTPDPVTSPEIKGPEPSVPILYFSNPSGGYGNCKAHAAGLDAPQDRLTSPGPAPEHDESSEEHPWPQTEPP